MGKRGKTKEQRRGSKPLLVTNSDDESDSNKHYQDEIDDFHAGRDKVLLSEGYQEDNLAESDAEEEVLKVLSDDLLSSEDDDEEIRMYRNQLRRLRQHHVKTKMDSDLEEEQSGEDGLPDSKAWGTRRSRYYHTDVIDDKFDVIGSDDDEGKAVMEEKEALAIQKKMMEELNDQDFGLDMFTQEPSGVKEDTDDQKISKDLSKLSKREKLELLKKESPELITLIEDYISKMTEVKDIFQPLMTLVKDGKVRGSAAEYVRTRFHLNMNYCINVSFYLMLKAKHLPAQSHPVVKRLVQYRNLMKQLEPLDKKLRPEIDDVLERLARGEEIDLSPSPDITKLKKTSTKQKRKLKKTKTDVAEPVAKHVRKEDTRYKTEAEKEALDYYQMMKKSRDSVYADDDDEEEEDEKVQEEEVESGDEDAESKRAITYQIAKNKGLTTKKKREQRNPRVKHRKKYEKAKVRRKGQVRPVRTETTRYAGEFSGIRAGLKRGVKLG